MEEQKKDYRQYKHTHIQCKYNNRLLRGLVLSVDDKIVVVTLDAEYEGKNEVWNVGELKALQVSLIKSLKKTIK